MKIAIDISQIVYQGLGVATYTRELTKHLLKIDDKNQYLFYAGAYKRKNDLLKFKNNQPWNKADWRILPLPPKISHKLFNQLNLPLNLFLSSSDIFHASDWTHPRTSIPSVTTVHDLAFKKYPETIDPLVRQVQEKRIKRAIAQTSHLIADSKSTKHDLMQIYNVPDARISTIHLAVGKEFTPKTKGEIKQLKKKLEINGSYLLSLGTKEPRKNLQKTIEAFQAYKEESSSELKLVLAGRHGWGKKLSQNNPDIIETGFVDQKDLPTLYSGAEVFIYPSLYEGFGFPVLEAMACGTPVITSNVSSLPEVAGKAGVLVNPEDVYKLKSAIKKSLTRKNILTEKSLKQAAKFSWKETAQKTLEVYENIYSSSKLKTNNQQLITKDQKPKAKP